jgi:hypothetical protein
MRLPIWKAACEKCSRKSVYAGKSSFRKSYFTEYESYSRGYPGKKAFDRNALRCYAYKIGIVSSLMNLIRGRQDEPKRVVKGARESAW